MTPFDASWKEAFLKTLWAKEKLLVQVISLFPTMFSTLSKAEIVISVHLIFRLQISIFRLQMLSIWSGPKFCRVVMGQINHVGICLNSRLWFILHCDFLRLTHYHTMPHFDARKVYTCSCGKHFFYPIWHFEMFSAVCFNLDQSKILLSGNGLKLKLKSWQLKTACAPFPLSIAHRHQLRVYVLMCVCALESISIPS